MSLRLWLIQTISVVLFCTMLIGGLLIYWHGVNKVETEMQAAISVVGRISRSLSGEQNQTVDSQQLIERMIADFDGDRHIKATLLDGRNIPVHQSKLREPKSRAPKWLVRLLASPPRVIAVRLPPQFSRYGRIVLQTDAANEVAEVWADAKLYLMLLGLFCISVLSVLYVALGQALKPLTALMAGFAELGKGEQPAQITVDGPLELAQLAGGFNDMADRLVSAKDRNARLREQLETVQEEERAELARNLHDEVSPLLFSVDVDATNVAQLADSGDGTKIRAGADAIKAAVALLKSNVKTILVQLRPGGLHALSLKSTIEELTTFWKARDPELTFGVTVPEKSWGVKLDSAVQSIVRESLSNAVKHNHPTHIDIVVRELGGEELVVEIGDNGGGWREPESHDGLGVIGMRERAALLGGKFDVVNRSNPRGVLVRATLPLGAAGDEPSGSERDGKQLEDDLV